MDDPAVLLLQVVGALSCDSWLLFFLSEVDFQSMEFLLNVIDTALSATGNRCYIFLTVFDTLFQVIHFIAVLGELIETELEFFGLAVDLVLGAFDCAETRQSVLDPNSMNERNENQQIKNNRCKSRKSDQSLTCHR